ncbi:hypothetical protein F4604DRAFT_910338 [Suillus subluteus]|nr:hypothetical protein F4604DRAFT_910338 [Suillus subluteus]
MVCAPALLLHFPGTLQYSVLVLLLLQTQRLLPILNQLALRRAVFLLLPIRVDFCHAPSGTPSFICNTSPSHTNNQILELIDSRPTKISLSSEFSFIAILDVYYLLPRLSKCHSLFYILLKD